MDGLVSTKSYGAQPRSLIHRLPKLLLLSIALAGWVLLLGRSGQAITSYATGGPADSVWLYDWRVHYAGAVDLLERDLYWDGGIAVGDLRMPVAVFNLPPAAAAIAVPFLPFGYQAGGLLWVVLGLVATASAMFVAARRLGGRGALVVIGLFWLVYVFQPFFDRVSVLGNGNGFVLAVLVAFVLAHLAGRQRLAGALLGGAIALKAWPLLIAIAVIRERRWLELAWAGGVVAAQGLLFIGWLGPGVVPVAGSAMLVQVPIPDGVLVIWTSWARETLAWWPWWGALAVAALLLAIPARGRLGLGLAILASLSVIPNLWDHYLPTFVLAGLLIASSPEVASLPERLRAGWQARSTAPG